MGLRGRPRQPFGVQLVVRAILGPPPYARAGRRFMPDAMFGYDPAVPAWLLFTEVGVLQFRAAWGAPS